jgi:hypothetical protein
MAFNVTLTSEQLTEFRRQMAELAPETNIAYTPGSLAIDNAGVRQVALGILCGIMPADDNAPVYNIPPIKRKALAAARAKRQRQEVFVLTI